MNAAVVYESCYGTTRLVAEAVAEGLRRDGDVRVLSVDGAPPVFDQLDLLVAGAPTHVHTLSSATSRRGVAKGLGDVGIEIGIGMRGWLRSLPPLDGLAVAAFDTRIHKPVIVTGSAARAIARRARRRGGRLVDKPHSFFVCEAEGPLEEGELERAADWAAQLSAPAGHRQMHPV